MSRLLFTLAMFALLVGLGALAVAARPETTTQSRTAPEASLQADIQTAVSDAAAPANLAAAPSATYKWTSIAIPLTTTTAATADGVADYIGSTLPPTTTNSIRKVARWNPLTQGMAIRNVHSAFGQPDFPVATGDFLMVAADVNAPTSFAWVGEVPQPGYRQYSLVSNGWTAIMLPLDKSSITTADGLADTINASSTAHVTKVAKWDATTQGMVIRNVHSAFGQPNYAVSIGYPYMVYATSAGTWP